MKIKGAVLTEIGRLRPYVDSQPLSVVELELDDPGPDEVLVRIEAAGLCHSDLSVVNGNRPRPVPMLLGHEAAGVVVAVGSNVDDVELGQRVVTVFLPRCGSCGNCATGGKLPCVVGSEANAAGVLLGNELRLHRDGESVNHHLGVSAFATHAVVNRKSIVPVDSDIPPQVAAVLGCAVLTGGGAVINAAKPQEGDTIMIVGLGGVGMAALLTALSVTSAWSETGTVIGVDSNPDKLRRAMDLGSSATYSPDEVVALGIKASIVIEAAGHPRAFETAVSATAAGGTTVTVGLPAPGATAAIEPLSITAEARTIIGSYLGSAVPSRDIPIYVKMWREGRLPLEELISSVIELDEINLALDELADGKAIRQVVVFN
ncbi:alcohol dehydrogenase catalytic domain-containing protein [Cryobacterium sp. PH29-G1]|uniref:alcohol dehydrogenase catalytic domain-containing protein n=1 Tax=Cryobacterium sp. PH29-G1 TaxID=3046211 RepID=UPI0024B8B280|nr:alcohol dehydrogenase catalytic domain-containing protein [Cryobacterium sp. PH29-G1]MDJ0350763.1 alcohol dehydrogenase catalytic domain-containing protein [Cryobacterium sp. PH29-G1]